MLTCNSPADCDAGGGQAYDEDRQEDAISFYEEIIRKGVVASELFYNLGNSYFRKGDLPMAILNYQKALHLSPRDPDVKANLEFALNTAGALDAPPNIYATLSGQLNTSGWVVWTVTVYWLLAFCLCLWLLIPRFRRTAIRLMACCVVLLIISTAALLYWNDLQHHPEAVIIDSSQQARFAPIEGSTIHFEVPPGSIVRILETQGLWAKILVEKQVGWVKREGFCVVYPWQTQDM